MDKLAIRGKLVSHFKTEPLAKVDVSSFPRKRESIENLGSRVALRLPGMTTSSHFQGSCKRLDSHLAFYEILGGCDFGEISNLKK